MAGRPLLVAVSASALLALALAGCISNSQPLQSTSSPLAVPPLPSLGFAKEVAVDKDHRGGEPSILADHKGNYYISAPSGAVATLFNSVVDPTTAMAQGPQNRESFIWKSKDKGATWQLLSLTPPPLPPLRGDAVPGGADTDLAVDNCNTVYFTDLWLGNIGVSHSDDEGATWTGVPVTGLAPVLDRNWIAAGKECGTVYLLFQTFYGQLWVLKSTDKGMTFPQQTLVMDCNGLPIAATDGCYTIDGPIVHDAKTNNLYFVAGLADGKGVWVFKSSDDGVTWSKTAIKTDADINNIFPILAADRDGNLFVVWSMNHGGSYNIYLSTSTDEGKTFTTPISVSGPEGNDTEVMPWVAAGDAGKVVVAWYQVNETVDKTDDAKGDWYVYSAASDDALSTTPHWATQRVSDKPNHHGDICTLGLTCTEPQPLGTRGNRNLADFLAVGIDGDGRAILAWADDHETANTFISHPMFARQASGVDFGAMKMGGMGNMTR